VNIDWINSGACWIFLRQGYRAEFSKFTKRNAKKAEKWVLQLCYQPRLFEGRDHDIEVIWPMKLTPTVEAAKSKAEEIIEAEFNEYLE